MDWQAKSNPLMRLFTLSRNFNAYSFDTHFISLKYRHSSSLNVLIYVLGLNHFQSIHYIIWIKKMIHIHSYQSTLHVINRVQGGRIWKQKFRDLGLLFTLENIGEAQWSQRETYRRQVHDAKQKSPVVADLAIFITKKRRRKTLDSLCNCTEWQEGKILAIVM